MKQNTNIRQLRKRFHIKEHWGVSDALVRLMADCRGFNPRIPTHAASSHALCPTLHSEFYRESALRMAREAEERPESVGFIVLGQIIEYHLLADYLSGYEDVSPRNRAYTS